MPTEQRVQELVHKIEEGQWAPFVRWSAVVVFMIAMFITFVMDPWYWGFYKGLAHPKAMEQAQIAREIARGNGFSTKMIRPLAYANFKQRRGSLPETGIPDTYHAPLWPALLAPGLLAVKYAPDVSTGGIHAPAESRWTMSTKDYIYAGDRAVSATAMFFFFMAILVSYFTVRRIFDKTLGGWVVLLMLGCSYLWQYSMSGLPQMFMLFLFSGIVYCLVRAIENRSEERSPLGWIVGMSVLFGLLILTHGIGFWTFLGALAFCTIYFQPRVQTAVIMCGVCLLMYSPWAVRNYTVCGNPLGISFYNITTGLRGGESIIMRSQEANFSGISPTMYRRQLQTFAVSQMGKFFGSFGNMMVAPLFFLALLYLFKGPVSRTLRWALLLMWLTSMVGMGIFGLDPEPPFPSNDLNVLFLPFFAAYGIAYLLIQWSRLEINVALVRYGFFALVYGLCCFPFLNQLSINSRSPVQWPPYVPPFIALLREWTTEEEIVVADIPWAVAWYADRKSFWLPMTIQEFIDVNDYRRLGGRIAGIYLTPYTGNLPLVGTIIKGEYKEWAPFIMRNVTIRDFPFQAVTGMPLDNQCIFYADRRRWEQSAD